VSPPSGATPPPGRSGLPKLRAGELRAQVLAALAADPDRAWTVGQVSAALGGRSSGAVGNALARLAADGQITPLPGPPCRYRGTAPATPATAAAAPIAANTAAPSPAPPAPAPGGSAPPNPGAVRRPNGQWYLPRELAGGTDVEVLRRLRAQRIPALLYGPPGTGKTSLVEAAFPDVVTIAGHGDTCAEDLLGCYVPLPDGRFAFSHGPAATAMREGRSLFVDDATLISPKVLAVLYPVMDGRGAITIPANNETISAADGFYVVAGHNPGVHGAVLTEALASRFGVHIEVTTDFALARSLGVPGPAVSAAANLNTQLRNGEIDWAPQLRELLAFARIADTLGTPAAVANLASIAPDTDRPAVIAALRAAFGRAVTPLTLGDQR
jgi:MoxR-like ATPase